MATRRRHIRPGRRTNHDTLVFNLGHLRVTTRLRVYLRVTIINTRRHRPTVTLRAVGRTITRRRQHQVTPTQHLMTTSRVALQRRHSFQTIRCFTNLQFNRARQPHLHHTKFTHHTTLHQKRAVGVQQLKLKRGQTNARRHGADRRNRIDRFRKIGSLFLSLPDGWPLKLTSEH